MENLHFNIVYMHAWYSYNKNNTIRVDLVRGAEYAAPGLGGFRPFSGAASLVDLRTNLAVRRYGTVHAGHVVDFVWSVANRGSCIR